MSSGEHCSSTVFAVRRLRSKTLSISAACVWVGKFSHARGRLARFGSFASPAATCFGRRLAFAHRLRDSASGLGGTDAQIHSSCRRRDRGAWSPRGGYGVNRTSGFGSAAAPFVIVGLSMMLSGAILFREAAEEAGVLIGDDWRPAPKPTKRKR